jgi:hypothetical protein
MNKRAKKRLKEALKKDVTDKAKAGKEDNAFSSPKQQPVERRGFIAKPAKKRG